MSTFTAIRPFVLLLLVVAMTGCAEPPPPDSLELLRDSCLSAESREEACRNYVIQAVREQKSDQARGTVEELIRRGGENAFLAYLLGEIELRRGEADAALPHYERGLALADDADDELGRQRCLNALGWLAASSGQIDKGRELLEQAIEAGEEAGAALAVAKTLSNLAYVERSTGRYAAALENLRRAIPILESEGNEDLLRRVLSNDCELSRQVGSLRRARAQCRRAHALAVRADDPRGLASVSIVEGLIFLDEGEYTAAEKVFLEAAGHARRAELEEFIAHAVILSGVAQTRQGDPVRALATLRGLVSATSEQRLRHRLYLGQALRKVGDLKDARSALDEAASLAQSLERAEEAWEIDVERASLARASGDHKSAISYAREAVAAVESMREAIPIDAERTRFLHSRTDVYQTLAASLLDDAGGVAGEAVFSVMEDAHARALREALGEQDPERGAEQVSLRLSQLQAQLPPEDLLLEYLLGEDESLLLAITRDSAEAFALPPRCEIEVRLRAYRAALLRPATSVDARLDPERDFRRYAGLGHELFEILLSPAGDLLADAEGIVVVPDRCLHLLPFAALVMEAPIPENELRFVADRWESRSLPAAAFLSRVPGSKERAESGITLIVAGEGAAAYGLAPLAYADAEAAEITRVYGPEQVERVDDAAEGASLLTGGAKPRRAVLQVISHAQQDPESGPQLVLGPAADPVIVRAEDIGSSAAAPPLVILSACETAQGEVVGGEGILGFVRAFTLAGSEAVVASLWSVDDARSAAFWGDTHAALAAGDPIATALTKTQRARSRPFEHPFYWAAFVVYGL